MTWTQLLPEMGEEAAGFVDPDDRTRAGSPGPGPDGLLESALRAVDEASGSWARPAGAAGWPAEVRRQAALRVHLRAIGNGGAPDEGPARVMPALFGDDVRWTRSELAWALRTSDGYDHYDGGGYHLAGHIAVSLNPAELQGFGPALRAVLDEFIDCWSTPRHIRRQLAVLYGTAIGRAAGCLPLDLLPWSCGFGEVARQKLGAGLDGPVATATLRHAASLTRPVPSRAWLREATRFPDGWPIEAVLECFTEHRGYVWFGTDELLRGLVWMLSLDPREEAAALLCRVAVAASTADPAWPRSPFAPQTAAAAVEVLAGRTDELSARTLAGLSRTVRSRPLLNRIRKARRA
ncbi:hypothetical protein Ait01nite_057910 [Actinoplanes italicus]|uniref:Uncharacterized protein n=1 Tax=Actinoplanes italicus TaxID=113567 RepID=A0A2T0K6I2_9ACTN|nr:hypothetical protein [Actinoplanes italicus]PRX18339.1 hypothetical protein CLV67_113173 [Actinoplanes italicus]GIE32746.1 hypothetical protein Ait01nite_057910 [Actinoplanes italicus]